MDAGGGREALEKDHKHHTLWIFIENSTQVHRNQSTVLTFYVRLRLHIQSMGISFLNGDFVLLKIISVPMK